MTNRYQSTVIPFIDHVINLGPSPGGNFYDVGFLPLVFPSREEKVCLIQPHQAGKECTIWEGISIIKVSLLVHCGISVSNALVRAPKDVPGVILDQVHRSIPL